MSEVTFPGVLAVLCKPGGKVLLNSRPRLPEFHGKEMTIEEVRNWGLTGYCEWRANGYLAQFPYRAAWDQIERVLT